MKVHSTKLLIFRSSGFLDNPQKKKLLRDWCIIRFTVMPYPDEPNLINSDLRRPLPFADNTFDSIYSYHVSEHLTPEENLFLFKEMYRILRVGGVLRISTPDLEFKAREYLAQLDAAAGSVPVVDSKKYDWAVIDLLDQMVRKKSGGRMGDNHRIGNFDPAYDKRLYGDTLRYIFDASVVTDLDHGWKKTYLDGRPAPMGFRLRKMFWAAVRKIMLKTTKSPLEWWQEKESWIYDRVSMRKLLQEVGMREIKLMDYKTSDIADWPRYDFDRSTHGDYPFEPSLFMEGKK